MDQPTRMFRVLACLAACMTGGTVLLSHLEPLIRNTVPRPLPAQYVEQARTAIRARRAPVRSWSGITIVPLREPPVRATLAAVRPQHDVHFVVDSTGNVVARRLWLRQSPIEGSSRIGIGLPISQAADPLSRAQVLGLTTLLDELNTTVYAPGKPAPLPIKLDERIGGLPPARALRALLDTAIARG